MDVGGALDALGHTAESLISQAYQRKVGQQQFQLQQTAQQQAREQQVWARGNADRQFAFDQSEARRRHDLEVAKLPSEGVVFDDDEPSPGGSLTAGAYGTPPAAPTPVSPAAGSVPSSASTSPAPYASMTQRAFNAPQLNPGGPGSIALAPPESAAASMNAAPPPPASAAPAAGTTSSPRRVGPSFTVDGRRAHYDYSRSAAGQAETEKEGFTAKQAASTQSFEKDLEGLRSNDIQQRAESQAKLEQRLKLESLPAETKAKIEEGIAVAKARFQYSLPKPDEMRTVGHVPELVGSLQDLDKYKPNLVAAMAHGTLANYIKSPEGQQYDQAVNDFVSTLAFARGTKAPRQAELDALRKAYSPQPGDSQQVLEQKTRQRMQAVRDIVGSAPRAGALLDPAHLSYLGIDPTALPGGTAPPAAITAPPAAGATPPARRVGPQAKASLTGDTLLTKYGIKPSIP